MATTATLVDTDFEAVIGLEVHCSLDQKQDVLRLHRRLSRRRPNTHVCPVCLGMPGVLPVMNRVAVESMLMTALALNCEIPEASKFDRKNYSLSRPDEGLPDLAVRPALQPRRLADSRAARRDQGSASSASTRKRTPAGSCTVDANGRAALHADRLQPLGRAVDGDRRQARPALAAEARAYLLKLRAILQTIGISSGNMEEGAFRCDANISVRPVGTTEYGTKAEVKNMNSFRAVFRALEYEIERQTAVLEEGGRVVQETRGWVEDAASPSGSAERVRARLSLFPRARPAARVHLARVGGRVTRGCPSYPTPAVIDTS